MYLKEGSFESQYISMSMDWSLKIYSLNDTKYSIICGPSGKKCRITHSIPIKCNLKSTQLLLSTHTKVNKKLIYSLKNGI